MSENKMIPKTFRTSKENLDYLQRLGKINHRSISQLIHLSLSYVIENHRNNRTGNQVNLDLLRILGPSEAPSYFSSDSGLLCNETPKTEGRTK